MLLIFFGRIGTGKTSVAEKVAEKLRYEFINWTGTKWSAVNKKKIYDDNDNFLLTTEEIQKVYDAMHEKAKSLLENGKNVVLESMYFKKQRDQAVQLTKDLGIPYILIEAICNEDEIKERLEKRKRENPQSPGFGLYLKYKDAMEKEDSEHITIDTSGKTVEQSAEEVIGKITSWQSSKED